MNSDLKAYIGITVRNARERKEWTQERLAEEIQKSVETVSNVERGFTHTGLATLEKIAMALDVPIRDFFPDDNYAEISVKRLRKEEELRGLVRSLSDDDIEVATRQIAALAERR